MTYLSLFFDFLNNGKNNTKACAARTRDVAQLIMNSPMATKAMKMMLTQARTKVLDTF